MRSSNETDADIEKLIQAIYQNCPNLRYLKLTFNSQFDNSNSVISTEFEKLLINCQFLNGFIIGICDAVIASIYNISWDKLFEILTRSSPISLFKFKFYSYDTIKLEYLKSFFDNWINRKPMLLKIFNYNINRQQLEDLTAEYKAKGIIKRYYINHGHIYKDFEWI